MYLVLFNKFGTIECGKFYSKYLILLNKIVSNEGEKITFPKKNFFAFFQGKFFLTLSKKSCIKGETI